MPAFSSLYFMVVRKEMFPLAKPSAIMNWIGKSAKQMQSFPYVIENFGINSAQPQVFLRAARLNRLEFSPKTRNILP